MNSAHSNLPTRLWIDRVENVPIDSNYIAGAYLDTPAGGMEYKFDTFEVRGWAFSPDSSLSSVQVTYQNILISHTVATRFFERYDVANLYASAFSPEAALNTGFHIQIDRRMLPAQFELLVELVFHDRRRMLIGRIYGHQEEPRFEPMEPLPLSPVLVVGTGRSGTTILMRHLLSHPEIVARDSYPYEFDLLTYYSKVARVLSLPADTINSERPDQVNATGQYVGSNPYFAANYGDFIMSALDQQGEFWRESIGNLLVRSYRRIAKEQGKTGPLKYFAEKFPGRSLLPFTLRLFPQSKAIFIARDPRDIWLSIHNFNQKRGYDGGWLKRATEDNPIGELIDDLRYYNGLDKWFPQNVFRLRYEDLMNDPHAAMTKVFNEIGVRADDATMSSVIEEAWKDSEELAAHRTGGAPKETVARWKRDMPAEQQKWFSTKGADLLTELGYEV